MKWISEDGGEVEGQNALPAPRNGRGPTLDPLVEGLNSTALSRRRVLGLAGGAVVGAALLGATPKPASALTFQLCADFSLFPDDAVLGPNFTLAAFKFHQLGGSPPLFVNVTGSERGLQFPPQGVEVTLPVPRRTVGLRIGTFNGPVDIAALDSSGTTVKTKTIPGLNSYVDTSLRAPKISSVVLTNGGNEGILVRICVALSIP